MHVREKTNKNMKPTIENFNEVSKSCKGNISKIAESFQVTRSTIHRWANTDEAFKDVIDDNKGALLDECITTSRIVALGIAEKDEHGNFLKWIEKPDPSMLRYFMSTLGRKEGFGDNVDLTTNGKDLQGSISIDKWLKLNLEKEQTI